MNEFILSRPFRDDQTLRHFKQIETHETYYFKFMRHTKHIGHTNGQGNDYLEVRHVIRAEEYVVKDRMTLMKHYFKPVQFQRQKTHKKHNFRDTTRI